MNPTSLLTHGRPDRVQRLFDLAGRDSLQLEPGQQFLGLLRPSQERRQLLRGDAAATLAMCARELAETTSAEVVLIWNTNARGLAVMAEVEGTVEIPVFDSTAIGVWACLDALPIDTSPAAHLGSLFRSPSPASLGG